MYVVSIHGHAAEHTCTYVRTIIFLTQLHMYTAYVCRPAVCLSTTCSYMYLCDTSILTHTPHAVYSEPEALQLRRGPGTSGAHVCGLLADDLGAEGPRGHHGHQ